MVVCVNTGRGVFGAVPVVCVTGCNMVCRVVVSADGQVQSVGTGTAVDVDVVVGVYSC